MSGRAKLVAGLTATVVAAAAVVALAQVGSEPPPGAGVGDPRVGPTGTPASPPAEAAPPLRLRVGAVSAVSVKGRVPRSRLRATRRGVERTIADLYTLGFVDREAWGEGRFPGLAELFAPDARARARRDRAVLTLGEAARRITAVRGARARLSMRVLTDQRRRPTAVLAEVWFRATALQGEREAKVRHHGSYVLRRLRRGWRIVSYDLRGQVPPARRIRRTIGAPAPRSGLFFVLAIGSDARAGERVAGARADSLHIIGVDLRKGRAGIVGIPRDSFVPIPGVGTRKINEALVYGGPELTVRTVERLSGIQIDAYLLTGFRDFRSAVTHVGGVRTRIPYAMSDAASEAFFRPGTKRLKGPHALAFSRNRHDAPGGDFGRSLNQGRLLLDGLREFRSDLRRDPTTLFRWVAVGARYIDTDLSLAETLGMLLATTAVDPSGVRNAVVSGTGGMVGGQSVVHLGSGAQAIFRDLRRDAVLNGR